MIAPTPDASARLQAATVRLTRLSEAVYSNPHRLFDWPARAAPDRLAMSESLLSLAGHECFAQLRDEQRWRLALLEAVNFFSLNISGERELMAGLAQRLYRGGPAYISRYLQHIIHEENAHSVLFARFCLDYGGQVYPDRQLRVERAFLPGEEEFLFFTRILIFEEIALRYNHRLAVDSDLWLLVRSINRYHADDEARHIAFGRRLVEDLWQRHAPFWTDADRERIGGYLARYMEAVLRSYVNPAVYRAIGLSHDLREDVLASPHWIALAAWASRRIAGWLVSIGVPANAR